MQKYIEAELSKRNIHESINRSHQSTCLVLIYICVYLTISLYHLCFCCGLDESTKSTSKYLSWLYCREKILFRMH